jgi:hypothetical protein
MNAKHEASRSSWDKVAVVAEVLEPLEHGFSLMILFGGLLVQSCVLLIEEVLEALESEALFFV